MILINRRFLESVFLYHFPDLLPIARLPACVDAKFHHATLGGLCRMCSLSGAGFSSQRGCSSQETGCILTATSDVTWLSDFLLSSGIPSALGAALVQEGNYLSTAITSMPAILHTWAPDESPLPTVEEFLDQFTEWSCCSTLCMLSTA